MFVAVLVLAGCKSTDSKPNGKEPTGAAASRTKTKDPAQQKWLDPSAGFPAQTPMSPPRTLGPIPTARTSTPRPKPRTRSAARSSMPAAGPRRTSSSASMPSMDKPAARAALGIMTDQNGYFFTRGLKSGQTYNLTAEATEEGKPLVGTMQTRVPNPIITIVLREDNGQPKARGRFRRGLPAPTGRLRAHSTAWREQSAHAATESFRCRVQSRQRRTRPVPATIGAPSAGPGVVPSVGPVPPPDDLANPATPSRPENVAEGPRGNFTPPTVNIPGPPGLPPSLPNPVAPKEGPDRNQSLVRPGANFVLIDTLERNWDFATNRSGSFILLEFVTTACPNCKPCVPVLKNLQSRYAADGLQVVAVLCDEVPQHRRTLAAAKYARDNNTNYAVYVEPGPQTGTVRDHFRVDGYPTAVLLDPSGAVLWKGHPAKRTEIEAAVRRAVRR